MIVFVMATLMLGGCAGHEAVQCGQPSNFITNALEK